jgi:hypothetical protein
MYRFLNSSLWLRDEIEQSKKEYAMDDGAATADLRCSIGSCATRSSSTSTARASDSRTRINAELFRKEDTTRCEEMYLKLQSGISKGDPRHIDTAVCVLAHKAKLNGYAIEPEQVSGSGIFTSTWVVRSENE